MALAACVASSSEDTTNKASSRASPGESEEQPATAASPKPPDETPACVTVIDIGNGFGGDAATPRDINEHGQVVGIGFLPDSTAHAFFWEAGGPMRDLGTLGGPQSNAAALNDRGETVGNAELQGGQTQHATLWKTDGTIVDLGTLGGDHSSAADINNAGQIVGNATTATGETHAFLWDSGVMKDLGTLGGNGSVGLRINDRGQVLGHSRVNGVFHVYLWENGVMTDLNPTPGGESRAGEINAHGDITIDSGSTAHFWSDGAFTQVRPFNDVTATFVSGLNDRGQVVGGAVRANGREHGFLWHNGVTTMIGPDFASPGFVTALAINKHAQVMGFARSGGQIGRAFSWKDGELIYLAAESESSVPLAMNDRGQIVGTLGVSPRPAKLWETHRCHMKDADAGAPEDSGKTW